MADSVSVALPDQSEFDCAEIYSRAKTLELRDMYIP